MASRVIGTATINVTANTAQFRQQLNGVTTTLTSSVRNSTRTYTREMEGGFRNAMSNISGFTRGVAGGFGQIGSAIAGLGLGRLANETVGFATETTYALDRAGAMFRGLTDSEEEAQAMLAKLTQYAIDTPFELPSLSNMAAQLIAVGDGFGVTTDNVTDYLDTLGNVTAASGGSEETMLRLVRVLGQMSSSGKVLGQDMNQLAQNIPGLDVWGALAEGTGKSVEELRRMQDLGTLDNLLTGNEAVEILLESMKEFPGAGEDVATGMDAMDRRMNTLEGSVSKFKESMAIALSKGMQPFFKVLQDTLGDPKIQAALDTLIATFAELATEIIRELAPVLPSLIYAFQNIVAALIPAAPLVGNLAMMFAHMMVALGPLIVLLGEFLIWITDLILKLDPFVIGVITAALLALWVVGFSWIGLAVAAIVALAMVIAQNWDTITAVTQSLVDKMIELWDSFYKSIVEPVKGWIEAIIGFFQDLYDTLVGNSIIPDLVNAIIEWFTTLWNAVMVIFNAIKSFAITVWNAVSSAVRTVVTTMVSIVTGVFRGLKATIETIWNGIKTAAQTAWNLIRDYIYNPIVKAKDWVVEKIDALIDFIAGLPGAISDAASGMWEGLKSGLAAVVNWIIGKLNTIIDGANTVLDGLDKAAGPVVNFPSIPHIPKISAANGAVLYGPTSVLAGEYPGASSNPEIIAPQSMMYDTMRRAIHDAYGNLPGRNGRNGSLVEMHDVTIQDATDADLVAQRTLVALQAAMA